MDKPMSYLEAISILECMAINMTGAIADMSQANPMYDVICQRLDAIDLAQEALREKVRSE